jgi:hypothetical protein
VIGVTTGLLVGSAGAAHAASSVGPTRNTASGPAGHPRQAANQQAGRHVAAPEHPAPTPVPATSSRPYRIYDSVTPSAIPAHERIATYANGDYAVNSSQLSGRGSVLWIDATGSDPSASVLDVEPGDASPSTAAWWAWQKLHSDPSTAAIIYTMRSEWPSVRSDISTLPSHMQSQVRYWIADPTGVQHMVPGAEATQWYWGHNYDISTANPGF